MKKTFYLDTPLVLKSTDKVKPLTRDLPLDMHQTSIEVNQQIIDSFVDLFGPKWKYRAIKETEQLTGLKVRYQQLKHLEQGKTFLQQTLFALIFVLAQHRGGVSLNFRKTKKIILK